MPGPAACCSPWSLQTLDRNTRKVTQERAHGQRPAVCLPSSSLAGSARRKGAIELRDVVCVRRRAGGGPRVLLEFAAALAFEHGGNLNRPCSSSPSWHSAERRRSSAQGIEDVSPEHKENSWNRGGRPGSVRERRPVHGIRAGGDLSLVQIPANRLCTRGTATSPWWRAKIPGSAGRPPAWWSLSFALPAGRHRASAAMHGHPDLPASSWAGTPGAKRPGRGGRSTLACEADRSRSWSWTVTATLRATARSRERTSRATWLVTAPRWKCGSCRPAARTWVAFVVRAAAFRADLIVIGAYGHSHLSEWIFGGVHGQHCARPSFQS